MTDRYHLPSHLITSQAHWDAMADTIGDDQATRLYGSRPELYNSADSVERLYFNDKAPRRALWVVIGLAAILAGSVTWAALSRPVAPEGPTVIDPCALVQTREGVTCR